MNWQTRIAALAFSNTFVVSAYASPDIICRGDSSQLIVNVSGGSGTYTFSWTSIPPGFTSNEQTPWVKPTVSTQYVIEVGDGTNTRIDTVSVAVSQEPIYSAGNDSLWCFPVNQCQLNGSAYNFQHIIWETSGNGTFSNDTIARPIYTLGSNDKITKHIRCIMTVYPLNFPYGPCLNVGVDTVNITLDWCNAIEEQIENVFNLTVVPNPSHESVTFTVSGINNANVSLSVYDMQGRIVFNDDLSGSTVSRKIDVSSYPKGIYFVRAISNGNLKIEKLVIQ